MHTNDHHGAVLPNEGWGGLAQVANYIKSVRSLGVPTLLLDAGDVNTGPAISNMFKAKPDIDAYNMMGYDAVALGNHEFDNPLSVLKNQIAESKFPWISANVKNADGTYLVKPYIIKKIAGQTIGIFGLTTCRTPLIANVDPSLKFENEIDTAKEMVTELQKQGCNIIIAVTHMGDVKESDTHITSLALAKAVPQINIIVDGHSHSYFASPKKVGDTYVVTAGTAGKWVGTADIHFKDGKIASFDWSPVPIQGEFGANPAINKMLQPFVDQANAALKKVIGQASADFPNAEGSITTKLQRYKETALGNWIADSAVWYFNESPTGKGLNQHIDFFVINGGDIRIAIPKGPITQEEIVTCLPFNDTLQVCTMKGSDLEAMFDFIATLPQGNGGFPQFSKEVGYTITYPTSGGAVGGKITNLTIDGKAIDPNKNYTFGTNDWLLGGGDGWKVLKDKSTNKFNTSTLLVDVLGEYLQAQPNQTITPKVDGMVKVVGGVQP
jgi:5'-nucleotidase/UDP-sugar diphosphatase